MTISHICGSIIVQAHNSFLNGAGTIKEGKEVVGVPKTFQKDGILYPYVSAQCWRRCWKATFKENIVPILSSDPVEIKYASFPFLNALDDIFGYFEANEQRIEIQEVNKVNVSQVRSSPFQISQLHPIQKFGSGTHQGIVKDKAYVHLKDGTPLPYTSRFYNADLEAMFAFDLGRLCTYMNFNDRQELSANTINEYLNNALLTEVEEGRYQLIDADSLQKKRALYAIESLLMIAGGAKSAQFGTDISPKGIIAAGMNGGNPLLSRVFVMGKERPRLDFDRLVTVVTSNPSLFETPIYCGLRQNYLENLDGMEAQRAEFKEKTGVSIEICSPLNILKKFQEVLP